MRAKKSISSMLCVYALSTGLFTLAACYQDFYFSVVTKNPGGFKYFIPLALIVFSVICALYPVLGKRAKRPGAFAPAGTLFFSMLVLCIGLITPYHFSLLLRPANLIIQTINLIAAYANAAFVLFACISGVAAFCSLLARHRVHAAENSTPHIGIRMGWVCAIVLAGVTCAAELSMIDKWGHETLFLVIGITGILCAAAAIVLDTAARRHTL